MRAMGPPADLVGLLTDLGATLATAESLTGGRVAARVTSVPGSSAVYAGGVVSYQTEVKVRVLGVAAATVEEHGVVSAECAREMAAGARRLLRTTYAISTTGVAGPDRQEGREVGTVFVGVAGPGGVEAVELALDGDRATIQEATVDRALSVLADMISSDSRPAEDSGLG